MTYKKQRNFCLSLRRKCMKNYLKKIAEKGLTTNKSFWKFVKPFLTNKGFIGHNNVTLNHETKLLPTDKTFNCYYLNIVEKSSDTKANTFDINYGNTSVKSVKDIVNPYKIHPSITKVKQVVNGSDVSDNEIFSLKMVNETETKNVLRNLDINKASGIDTINPKIIKLSEIF